ncbi:MAG: hypothetical protein PHV17_06105 [Candidatus Omnitrophica bacterium]|nr:hypothetical protein [Candidatus Omnitrophota bacterium]
MSGFKIAKVLLPISLEKEFDYLIDNHPNVTEGMRVLVDFNRRQRVGLVTELSLGSEIKKLKPIITVLEDKPLLSAEQVKFARQLASVYPYSLGEFLFMMIPAYLKNARQVVSADYPLKLEEKPARYSSYFFGADTFFARYCQYKDMISKALNKGSVIVCLPQLTYLDFVYNIIKRDFKNCVVINSKQTQKELYENWRNSRAKTLILGTRMSMFYYPGDLELIVVEEENSPHYFQEEKPYYWLPDIADSLAKFKNITIIFSGSYPSLKIYKEQKNANTDHLSLKDLSSLIKVVDTSSHKYKQVYNQVFKELIRKNIEDKKRILVIWNRKEYSKIIMCLSCRYIYRCQRCSANLAFSLSENKGVCPYCSAKYGIPEICPKCNQGYLKSYGTGIKRVETILKTLFPETKIDSWENRTQSSRFVLATSQVLSSLYEGRTFDVGFVLDIDTMLSSLDYESTYKSFIFLNNLSFLMKESLYVFTANSQHYLFGYLTKNWRQFYDYELKTRRELGLPPYGALAVITLRGLKEKDVLSKAQALYQKLEKTEVEVFGPFQAQPYKLRSNYRYSVIIKSRQADLLRRLIKAESAALRSKHLKVAALIR